MRTILLTALALPVALPPAALPAQDRDTLERADGYRGIWYSNQPSKDEYRYKYSGGLGTYCAKHRPFAVYCEEVDKTFFCYGGAPADDPRRLLHMVSFFDHATGTVPRPVVLLDKQTGDAHDNPVIAVDDAGHVWIFSTSHGRARPSFVHKSVQPWSIAAFDRIDATYETDAGERAALDNFSYFQVRHVAGRGFVAFFTRYGDPAKRTSMFMTSRDGVRWSRRQRLAAIEAGHYQISEVTAQKAATMFNYHPAKKGLNWRTNLYYLETVDHGESWQNAAGERIPVPLTRPESAALVHDYAADGRLVYLKDLRFDSRGHPILVYITSRGYRAGPDSGPRTWTTARWTGERWSIHPITESDNNYDMGSLALLSDTHWQLVAPTEPGPQRFNPGGEVAAWETEDAGATWRKRAVLTSGSDHNHTYVRRPVRAHDDFWMLWADGHGRQPSQSRLLFCDRTGATFVLPETMADDSVKPTAARAR